MNILQRKILGQGSIKSNIVGSISRLRQSTKLRMEFLSQNKEEIQLVWVKFQGLESIIIFQSLAI